MDQQFKIFIESQLSSFLETIHEQNKMIESLREDTTSLQKEVMDLRNDNESMRNDIIKLNTLNETLQKDNTSLHQDITDLHEDNKALHKHVKTLKMDVSVLHHCIDSLRYKVTKLELPAREAAIAHLADCVARRDQCELDLKNFRIQYPNENLVCADPILHSRLVILINAKNDAWFAYFLAYEAVHPKTVEDVLWIVAKAGFTKEVAPLMNLSKVTRTCKNLQPLMMNVKLGDHNETQLHHCACNGLTTSTSRLLSLRNINVNGRSAYGWTPLHCAAENNHLEIAKLLIQKGAMMNVKSDKGSTPLLVAAQYGHVDILHLLVENGADLEAQNNDGGRALHWAVSQGHLPFIRELVTKYHVDINARDNNTWTVLGMARRNNFSEIVTFLQENGAIDDNIPADEDEIQADEEEVEVVVEGEENFEMGDAE
jgi:cell division protein FtsB